MQPPAAVLFGAYLTVWCTALASQPDNGHPAGGDSSFALSATDAALTSTVTHSGAVYVVVSYPSTSSSEPELEKRELSVNGNNDHAETTIVITTPNPALETILVTRDTSAQATALTDGTTTLIVGPDGAYGSGAGSGNNPSSGTGSNPGSNPTGGAGAGPGSGGPGSGPNNGPGSGPGSGTPSLPGGAYGQPPNTVGQQPPSPSSQQPLSSTGSETPNPTGVQSPNTSGQSSPNPNGQQPPNPTITGSGILVTTIPLSGTILETITISLTSAPGNTPFPTSCNPNTGSCGPSVSPTTQPLLTTFITIQGSNTPSTPCESNSTPISISNTVVIPTITITIPVQGESMSIPTTATPPNTIVVTVPGGQGQPTTPASAPGFTTTLSPSGWDSTTLNIPNQVTTSITPGWITTLSGSVWVTVPSSSFIAPWNSPHTTSTGQQILSSSTCSTDIYTNLISTSIDPPSPSDPTDPVTTTSAATMAVGSSTSSQHTTWSFATTIPTPSPVPVVNVGVANTRFKLSTACKAIVIGFIVSIITAI